MLLLKRIYVPLQNVDVYDVHFSLNFFDTLQYEKVSIREQEDITKKIILPIRLQFMGVT